MKILQNILVILLTIYSCLQQSSVCLADFALRQCELIRIEMCRNIGYNETSMPNLVGNELQSEAEYTLQTFSPLIEYVCSSQLKLFLCATYVPMCTPKVPVPIGPCRTLCESVRSRCHPVLQGFGYPWPPALDCNRFPKENNQETMCMEGPGEAQDPPPVREMYPGLPASKMPIQQQTTITSTFECPGHSKLYVKLHRSGRCAPLCDAHILFGPNEKHVAEIWTHTWAYAALGLALLAIVSIVFSDYDHSNLQKVNQTRVISPLMWCHTMVIIGWTVRFVAGRTATSCGFDPQLPNVSLLLVDGLSNAPCASIFILRYYFGMAACAWWAILCLGWHRDVRRNSPDSLGLISLATGNVYTNTNNNSSTLKAIRSNSNKLKSSITSSNLARFLAWGLPAFQAAAVIVARLVDADELLGACFVGNQSDKGLQILVATPLFCYWIFGSMNLASGFLVYRRNRDIVRSTNSTSLQILLQTKCCISGMFLFIYCIPCAILLLAIIYEFANIDIWLNTSPYIAPINDTALINNQTPEWPFLTRAFMELMLAIICSAWILGPKIFSMYKRQLSTPPHKPQQPNIPSVTANTLMGTNSSSNCRASNKSYSTVSYQTVRQPMSLSRAYAKQHSNSGILMNHMPNYSVGHNKRTQNHLHPQFYMNNLSKKRGNNINSFHRYGDETVL